MEILPDSDEALMLAYAAGDAAAFERLYGRHKGALFRFVLRSLNNRALAEELYQEIWLKVIHARRSYRPAARFATWLYHLASNRLIDHHRQQGKWQPLFDDDEEAACIVAADESAGPERQAAAGELRVRLLDCLGQLPAVQRQVFLLKEEAELTLEEIAINEGCGRETIKSRLRYALEKLRHCMGGWR